METRFMTYWRDVTLSLGNDKCLGIFAQVNHCWRMRLSAADAATIIKMGVTT